MRLLKTTVSVLAALGMVSLATTALAQEGGSGPHTTYPITGKLGTVFSNPYKIAPLTAIITNGGSVVKDASVRIVPKDGGQEIAYKVSDKQLLTHGGIPVFGLYPDYVNTVEVSYTKITAGVTEKVDKEEYKIYAPPAANLYFSGGYPGNQSGAFPKAEVLKMSPEFSDRLYLVNNFGVPDPNMHRAIWNNPSGGALEWANPPMVAIYDTKGEIRWYLDSYYKIFDPESMYSNGFMMGFRQNPDGAFTWGYGQTYVKYDLMGREIFHRRLPNQYSDFSHAMNTMPNGHYVLRVASANTLRADGKNVHTVRDVIIEVDQDGTVYDEWRLFDILDSYRDNVLKVLDQGAVCLNIDESKSGQTLSAEDLAKFDQSDVFGDVTGSGPGRNWAHVNSVYYDPDDDSIIISSRHQSAVIKIGRDKEVKWILGSPEGWKEKYQPKILTPVDKEGNPIKCENSKCEGDFDWTWTQHTGWKIPEKSEGRVLMLSVFDNGDGRGMEQPPMYSMKYSRAVIYKIDQDKMTAEQVWEYGKDRGNEWYSPVTSLVEYQPDKDSVVVYSATAGLSFNPPHPATPWLEEFKWGETEPTVEIHFSPAAGYQAMPVSVDKAFAH